MNERMRALLSENVVHLQRAPHPPMALAIWSFVTKAEGGEARRKRGLKYRQWRYACPMNTISHRPACAARRSRLLRAEG